MNSPTARRISVSLHYAPSAYTRTETVLAWSEENLARTVEAARRRLARRLGCPAYAITVTHPAWKDSKA